MSLRVVSFPRGQKASINTPGIRAIAAKLEPSLRRRFFDAVIGLNGNIDLEMLAKAIIAGELTPDILLRFRQWSDDLRPMIAIVDRGFQVAASVTSDAVATALQTGFSFDLTNPRCGEWAARYTYDLVRDLTDTTQAGLRSIISRAFTEGMPPAESARLIRPLIGLTERATEAVGRYWDRLAGEGRTAEAIARLSDRYAHKLIRARALLIARTEAIRGCNEGQQESWRQAVDQGLLRRDRTIRIWFVADDERLCDACENLDGDETLLEEPFSDGTMRPPHHPACRCSVAIRVDRTGAGPTRKPAPAA